MWNQLNVIKGVRGRGVPADDVATGKQRLAELLRTVLVQDIERRAATIEVALVHQAEPAPAWKGHKPVS